MQDTRNVLNVLKAKESICKEPLHGKLKVVSLKQKMSGFNETWKRHKLVKKKNKKSTFVWIQYVKKKEM